MESQNRRFEQSEQLSLTQFITQRQTAIPQDFSQRFVQNFECRGQWWNSSKAYDEWFNIYYDKYARFIQGIKRELVNDLDFKSASPRGDTRKSTEREEYLISYDGLKQLEMKCDKQTRVFYITLERLTQEFVEYQRQIQEEEKKDMRIQIEELKTQISNDHRSASTYKIKHNGNLLYVGRDKSENQNRIQTHLSERRRITQQYQLIDIFLATIPESEVEFQIQPCHYDDADDLEREMIQTYNPPYNQQSNNKIYTCPHCNKTYKSRVPFEKHIERCAR